MQGSSLNNHTAFRQRVLNYGSWGLGIAVLLYLVSLHNYLLFHSIAEGFSIVVAFGMFTVAWHTRKYSENGFLLFLGIVYASVACIDLLHMLSYEGMGIYIVDESDRATQFWVAARFIQSMSLLIAPFFLQRRLKPVVILPVYGALLLFVVFSIIWWRIFPRCFIPDGGLTQFKKISEYVITIIFAGAIFTLSSRKIRLEKSTYLLLTASILVTMVSETSFTLYRDPYSFANMLGHCLKIVAFFLTYRAVVAGTLEKPYGILFNNFIATQRKIESLAKFPQENPFPVMRIDSGGRILFANGAAAMFLEQLGCTSESITGVPPLSEAARSDVQQEIEIQSGDQWYSCAVVPITGQGYCNIYGKNITERKSTQEALLISEQRYALAQRAANIGTWDLHIPSGKLHCSDQVEPMFGLPRGSLDGTFNAFVKCIHPDDRRRVTDTIAVSIRTGREYNIEHRIVRPDGTVRWMLESAMLLSDQQNTPERLIGIVTDITQQYRTRQALEKTVESQAGALADTKESLERVSEQKMEAEAQLHQRQQALEAVYTIVTSFGSSLLAICDQVVMNIAAILKLESVVFFQLTDGKAGSPVHYRDGVLTHEEPPEVPCSACRNVMHSRLPFQYSGDLADRYPDSACFKNNLFGSYIAVPVLNYEAKTMGMICAMRREKKPFQQYEVHLIEIFARYVAYEITRRQLEKKMLQSQEMHLLGQLTSGVAHEVRNPLNALMAISEALFKRMGDTETYGQYITHIRNQIKRLSGLMEDLLALGRPVRRDDFTTIGVKSLLGDTIADWNRISPDRDGRVSLEVSSACEELSVDVDTTKMQQVIINILDNAEQHLPPGGTITATIDNNGNDTVLIAFHDTGSGIAAADLTHIFEPFFTTRKAGTGLGLSIVKNTVENHGGTIRIFNNDPPPGITVELTLPLSRVKNEATERTDAA